MPTTGWWGGSGGCSLGAGCQNPTCTRTAETGGQRTGRSPIVKPASWEESAGCGRGRGGQSHPATLPPLPCAHPSPSRGNPREVPGRMGYPCGAAALEKAFRSASAHKPASCAVARGSISAFAMAGLHSARRGRGAQPHGYSGSSSCCDWRESSCSFSAPQPTTTPSSGMPSVESLYVKAYPAPRRLPRASLSCPRERALGAELMGPLTRPIGCDITQNPVF